METTDLQNIQSIIQTKLPNAKPDDFVRYGFRRKGQQIYLHKPTSRRFVANDALPGRRIPKQQVADALSMFYEGMAYRKIQRNFQQKYGFQPSTATLYEWVRDFTQRAKRLMQSYKAKTGNVWVADEMMTKIDGKQVWLWNVMDRDSRYLLATHLSPTRTIRDARILFTKAVQRAERPPTHIITDGLRAYRDGIERVFGADTKHTISEGFRSPELHNNIAERLHGTIRERTKVMRGMETTPTAQIVMDGFQIYYNHIRPHHALRGRKPAQMVRLPIVFTDWVDVASLTNDQIEWLSDKAFQEKPLRVRNPFRSSPFRMRRIGGL